MYRKWHTPNVEPAHVSAESDCSCHGEALNYSHVYYVMEAIAFCEVSVRYVSVPLITTPIQCVVRRMFYPVLHSVHVCTVGLLHLLHEQSDSRLKKAMV